MSSSGKCVIKCEREHPFKYSDKDVKSAIKVLERISAKHPVAHRTSMLTRLMNAIDKGYLKFKKRLKKKSYQQDYNDTLKYFRSKSKYKY